MTDLTSLALLVYVVIGWVILGIDPPDDVATGLLVIFGWPVWLVVMVRRDKK